MNNRIQVRYKGQIIAAEITGHCTTAKGHTYTRIKSVGSGKPFNEPIQYSIVSGKLSPLNPPVNPTDELVVSAEALDKATIYPRHIR